MKTYHIQQFKCPFCSSWFDPYAEKHMPYLLSCGHSICKRCLIDTQHEASLKIICPEDLNVNIYKSVSSIPPNQHIKQLLKNILGEKDKDIQSEEYLEIIKKYSKKFETSKDKINIEIKNLFTLVDKLFAQQIKRIQTAWQKLKNQISKPLHLIDDWKQNIKNYLKHLRSQRTIESMSGVQHYVQEARKVQLEINNFFEINISKLVQRFLKYKSEGFKNYFSVWDIHQSSIQPKIDDKTSSSIVKPTNTSSLPQIIQSISIKSPSIRNSLSELIYSQSVNRTAPEEFTGSTKTKRTSYHLQERKPQFINSEHQMAALLLKKKAGSLKIQNNQNLYDCSHLPFKVQQQMTNHEKSQQLLISSNEALIQKQRNFQSRHEVKANNILFTREQTHPSYEQLSSEKMAIKLKQPRNLINFNSSKPIQRKNSSSVERIRKTNYDSDKYLKDYAIKNKILSIQQALQKSVIKDNQVEINCSVQQLDFGCFLDLLQIPQSVQMMKLMKIGMEDQHFNLLLNYLLRNRGINTLVMSHNRLTQQCLQMLLQFIKISRQLKNIYLSKNHINSLKAKGSLADLKKSGLNIYI